MAQQSRKQKILDDVKRRRKQRSILSITLAVILIVVIIGSVIAFRPGPPLVVLPDYLSHCVNGTEVYHSHPNLTITIDAVNIPLPSNTVSSSCPQPLHTHDASGVIHVETDENRDYTLHDWFLLWAAYLNNPTYATFDSSRIFGYTVDSTHHLTMTVDGAPNPSFENYVIPRNAAPTGGVGGTGLCDAPVNTQCVMANIVIKYG